MDMKWGREGDREIRVVAEGLKKRERNLNVIWGNDRNECGRRAREEGGGRAQWA